MAISSVDSISTVQRALQETVDGGLSWASGHWTVAEVVGYYNQRQYQFLKETMILLKRSTINTLPSVQRHDYPTDWIATHRLVWESIDDEFTEVPRSDGWEADHGILDWPYNQVPDKPVLYTDGEVPTLQFETMPSVNVAGSLQVLHAHLSTIIPTPPAAANLTVPDEFEPAVRWGVISDMLSKVGRAHDPQRAQYANARYLEGVAAARIILGGWM